jgi:hypothetical protein
LTIVNIKGGFYLKQKRKAGLLARSDPCITEAGSSTPQR